MFPYTKAGDRSLRRSSRITSASEEVRMETEKEDMIQDEEDIAWDYTEYKLTYVLDNFELPQIVRVLEGFMFTEDDSLASGTVLTIHGQQKVEQICAIDRNGQGNDIFIPLSCPYKVRVTVPDRAKVYRTVKDLCNATPLPKCVVVHEKITVAGVKIPSGRMLIIKAISKSRHEKAEGISVELLDNPTMSLVLPLKVLGNFTPCPLPVDQNRTYFVRELSQRPFPLWVSFISSFEKNPTYGPHMGAVKLLKLQTTNVVFSTSTIDGEKFAISFSRDLPVTVQMARDALLAISPYSNKCRMAGEQVDINVFSHLTDNNPYSDKYQSAIYADIFALRRSFAQGRVNEDSIDSFESLRSDTSCSEDRSSTKEAARYVIDKSLHVNGSIGSSFGADSHSIGSQSNQSNGSNSDLRQHTEGYVYFNLESSNAKHESEEDLEDEEGYTIIAERMDRPYVPMRQSRTKDTAKVRPYLETEIATLKPTQFLTDRQEKEMPQPPSPSLKPVAPPRDKNRRLKSTSSIQEAEPYSSRRSLDRTSSGGLTNSLASSMIFDMPVYHLPETLSLRSHDSDNSDADSLASEYLSVKSEPGLTAKAKEGLGPVLPNSARCPPRKPARPPRPVLRPSSKEAYDQVKPSPPSREKEAYSVQVVGQASFPSSNEKSLKAEVHAGMDKGLPSEETDLKTYGAAASAESINEKEITELSAAMSDISVENTLNDRLARQHDNSVDSPSKEEDEETISRRFSVAEAGEDDVGEILETLQLSGFKKVFKDEQINGALLEDLDIETLNDLGMDQFQAVKLLEYVKGWRPDEDCTGDANDPDTWKTNDVCRRMQEINLKELAEFCLQSQVDGRLLQSLIDSNSLQCLTDKYSVGLNKFNKNKLIRYVKKGWRPDGNK